jgi:hypothetical protein
MRFLALMLALAGCDSDLTSPLDTGAQDADLAVADLASADEATAPDDLATVDLATTDLAVGDAAPDLAGPCAASTDCPAGFACDQVSNRCSVACGGDGGSFSACNGGCCDGLICRSGSTNAACGSGGASCADCGSLSCFAVAGGGACLMPGQWEQRSPAASPQARSAYAFAFDSGRNRTVVFGGSGNQFPYYLDDTWEYDGTTWAQACTSTACSSSAPSPRSDLAMAYDAKRSRTVLFGGFGPLNGIDHGDTWEWDGTVWSQACTAAPCSNSTPPARQDHAMVFDSARGHIVLFGGQSPSSSFGDTWEYDGTSWTPVLVAGPSMRVGHAMVYDPVRARTVLFGGYDDSSGQLGDTWEYDGTGWTMVSDSGPARRTGHGMAWDAVLGRAVVFGGTTVNTAPLVDTWIYDAATASWTQLGSTVTPPQRTLFGMIFDGTQRRALLFGGLDVVSSSRADTWVFHPRGESCADATTCNTGSCLDGVCCESASCSAGQLCNRPGTLGLCN